MLGQESPHVGAGKSSCWGWKVLMLVLESPHVGGRKVPMLGQEQSPCWGRNSPHVGAGQSPYWGREIIREWPTYVAVLPHVCGFLQQIGRDALGPTNLLDYKTLLGHTSPVSPFRYPSLTAYAGRFSAVEAYDTPSPQFTRAWPRDPLYLIPSHTYFCLVFCTAELLAGIWTRKHHHGSLLGQEHRIATLLAPKLLGGGYQRQISPWLEWLVCMVRNILRSNTLSCRPLLRRVVFQRHCHF